MTGTSLRPCLLFRVFPCPALTLAANVTPARRTAARTSTTRTGTDDLFPTLTMASQFVNWLRSPAGRQYFFSELFVDVRHDCF